MSDFMGIVPAITGKVELVYEGEQEGAAIVAENLIGDSVRSLFDQYFPKIEKLKHADDENPYEHLTDWFATGNEFALAEELSDEDYAKQLDSIAALGYVVDKYHPKLKKMERALLMEFVLWGLTEYSKINKDKFEMGYQFKDLFDSYLSNTLRGED